MSFMELAIIAVLALVLLGPEQLPGVAKQLGKGLRALKGVADGVRAEVASEVKLGGEEGAGAQAAMDALREVRKVAEDATALLRGEEPAREPPARRKAPRHEPAGVVPAGSAGPSPAEAAAPGTAVQAPAEPAPPPAWRQVSLADAAASLAEPAAPRAPARAPAPAQPADPGPAAAPAPAGADVPEG
jgi:sec-independent protein translocase protein TatB